MSFTALYESRSHSLKPISITLTLLIALASMILGSILAIALSWAWILFTAAMLAIQSLRIRFASFRSHSSRSTPVTIEGVYTVINGSTQPKGNKSV